MATHDRTQTPHSDPLKDPKHTAPPADGDISDEQKRLADERRTTNPGAAKPQPPTPDNPQRGIVGPDGVADPARGRPAK